MTDAILRILRIEESCSALRKERSTIPLANFSFLLMGKLSSVWPSLLPQSFRGIPNEITKNKLR
jgi:hypothetical protein